MPAGRLESFVFGCCAAIVAFALADLAIVLISRSSDLSASIEAWLHGEATARPEPEPLPDMPARVTDLSGDVESWLRDEGY